MVTGLSVPTMHKSSSLLPFSCNYDANIIVQNKETIAMTERRDMMISLIKAGEHRGITQAEDCGVQGNASAC